MDMIAECFVDALQDEDLLERYVFEDVVEELDRVDDLLAGTQTFAVEVRRGVGGRCHLHRRRQLNGLLRVCERFFEVRFAP